jgi:hypothetical protein
MHLVHELARAETSPSKGDLEQVVSHRVAAAGSFLQIRHYATGIRTRDECDGRALTDCLAPLCCGAALAHQLSRTAGAVRAGFDGPR